MMKVFKRVRPVWILVILLLMVVTGWAVSELSGQANKTALNAGSSSGDMEMASLEMIKEPKTKDTPAGPPVDWAAERRLRQQLEGLDREYNGLVRRANNEIGAGGATGKVSPATGSALTASAARFKSTSDQYADVWEKGRCITRARLAREAGATRVASAELIASGADSSKSSALRSQQAKLDKARKDYVEEVSASGELSDSAKAEIRASVLPKAQRLVNEAATLVTEVTGLLSEIKSQTGNLTSVGGLTGCASTAAKNVASGGSPADGVSQLLAPVTNLLSLAQGLASNAQSLLSDVTTLIK